MWLSGSTQKLRMKTTMVVMMMSTASVEVCEGRKIVVEKSG